MTMPITQARPPRERARARHWEALRQLSDRTSLRAKLIAAMLALVIMALAAISVASVVVLRSYLTNQQDPTLTGVFAQISQSASSNFDPGHPPGFAYQVRGAQGVYAGLEQPGTPLTMPSFGNGGLGQGPQGPILPSVPTSLAWATANNGKLLTIGAQSGPDSWRVIAGPVSYGGQTFTLVVAYNLGPVTGEIQRLTTIELIVGTAIVAVLAIVGIAVVRANLRPLDDIEMTAGEIAKGRLDHRIPERDPRTEIGRLGRSLNMMLSQIEAAFRAQHESERAAHESEQAAHESEQAALKSEQAAHESEERMRRFIADASHELRTPLTTMRGFAEYYRQRGGVRRNLDPRPATDGGASAPAGHRSPGGLSPEDMDRIMQRLESEGSRMGLLVEDLLQLARLDRQRPLDMAPVDLLSLAADAVQDARIVAPGRPVELVVAPGAAFLVEGDEQRLRQVIGNLVSNALTHTPPGTPVRVKIALGTLIPPPAASAQGDGAPAAPWDGAAGPAVVLDVEDDGPGMAAEQAQRAFERFYRADQARNRASGGTGLGLAIVHGLVTAHGGTVTVSTAPGRGADFQVKLPLSPDAQAGALDDEDL